MNYESTRLQTALGTWRIERIGENATWLLKWKGNGEVWIPCDGYSSPHAAVFAVGYGVTGVSEWDAGQLQPSKFSIEQWRETQFNFPKVIIYQRLKDAGKDWCIYHHGLPQSAGIDWLRPYYIDPFTEHFGDMDDFTTDAKEGELPEYTFIEPCYDTGNNYVSGDSMHPMNDIRKGAALLKTVYEVLRASPTRESTMLMVTFDEHGRNTLPFGRRPTLPLTS